MQKGMHMRLYKIIKNINATGRFKIKIKFEECFTKYFFKILFSIAQMQF